MAVPSQIWQKVVVIVIFSCFVYAKDKPIPVKLSEGNWTQMLEGEWLVKFYAPWCPACRGVAPIWEGVAGWSEDLNVHVADIDVTENPGLSGRFLVTSLPTFYHVIKGDFRVYRGHRSEEDIISYVDDKQWKEVEPVVWYLAPTATHMAGIAMFFKLSMAIRDLHTQITLEFGIPVWGSYFMFAVATIIGGLILGLFIVCLCDCVCPPRHQALHRPRPTANNVPSQDDDDKDSDVLEDDRPLAQRQAEMLHRQRMQQQQQQNQDSPMGEAEDGSHKDEEEEEEEQQPSATSEDVEPASLKQRKAHLAAD